MLELTYKKILMNVTEVKFNIFLSGVIFLFACSLPFSSASAASYGYYVDASYVGDHDGSKEKPFSKISDAINANDSSSKIFIRKGNYAEPVIIKKGISLYGESRDKVSLSGGIVMKDDTSINNITIRGGGTAVSIDQGASVQISGCHIKKFGRVGIEALAGNGKVSIENSDIYDSAGKGIYIEMGRKIEISGNEIYDNAEEGIDVRAKVSGRIENNQLYSNGESGIEIIIGSSDVTISGNIIKKNGASGIASQFYQETKKTGQINIQGNTITKNSKYGLDCAFPSGGKPDSSYWSDSINLVENDMKDNVIHSINNFCNIIDAIDEVEEKITNETDEKKPEIIANEATENISAVDRETQEDEKIWEGAESANSYNNTLGVKVEEQITKINSAGKMKRFFLGTSPESLDFIKNELAIIQAQIEVLRSDLEKISNDETKKSLQSLITDMEHKSATWNNFVQEKEIEKGVLNRSMELLRKLPPSHRLVSIFSLLLH